MKNATSLSRFPSSALRPWLAMSLGIALACGLSTRADAVAVDSELMFLVDITQTGMNNQQFDKLMDSYAASMTSSQVLNSIQSGAAGRIAVSMVFYGGAFTQSVGVPWMSIGSMAEAQQFANIVSNLTRPISLTSPSISAALEYATQRFGTETGGASNGFESAVQVVEVVTAGLPVFPIPAADQAARNAALASGVDIINSIAVGNRSNTVENYFASNVVGGSVGGVQGSSGRSMINNNLDSFLATHFESTVDGGAEVSQAVAVPEPTSLVSSLAAAGFLLFRRRRHEHSLTSGRA
jgi:hypothetical protein